MLSPHIQSGYGPERIFLYTVLITNLGHSAFYSGSLLNKSHVSDRLVIRWYLRVIIGLRVSLLVPNPTMSCTHMAESVAILCIMCRHMSQTWQRAPLCQAGPGPSEAGGKRSGADSAGMASRNRSGQMGHNRSAGGVEDRLAGGPRAWTTSEGRVNGCVTCCRDSTDRLWHLKEGRWFHALHRT